MAGRRVVFAFVVVRRKVGAHIRPEDRPQLFEEFKERVTREIECGYCEKKFRPFFGAFGKRGTFCSQECLDKEKEELKRFYNRLRDLR